MTIKKIPVAGPWITAREIAYVNEAVRTAWYDQANVFHQRFEQSFAGYLGVRHAVALPSCTSALHLALLALGVGPGDEVIVPEITWIATAAPISYVGATPVFADVDPQSWCMDARSFRAAVSSQTRAVIPVDLYGNLPDMAAIRKIAKQHGLAVIEDAAEAIGSEYRGRKAGSLGDVGVFSFHGSKTLTTGEGGMLVTNRRDLHDRVLFLRDHGRDPGAGIFWNAEIAHKYKMSSMQAALGLAQFERIEELVARKRRIFSWYQTELASLPRLVLNHEAAHIRNSYWMVTAILDRSLGITKETLLAELGKKNIMCRPFFYPLSSLPAYRHLTAGTNYRQRNPISYRISPWAINLPSSLTLTKADVCSVCRELKQCLRQARKAA